MANTAKMCCLFKTLILPDLLPQAMNITAGPTNSEPTWSKQIESLMANGKHTYNRKGEHRLYLDEGHVHFNNWFMNYSFLYSCIYLSIHSPVYLLINSFIYIPIYVNERTHTPACVCVFSPYFSFWFLSSSFALHA